MCIFRTNHSALNNHIIRKNNKTKGSRSKIEEDITTETENSASPYINMCFYHSSLSDNCLIHRCTIDYGYSTNFLNWHIEEENSKWKVQFKKFRKEISTQKPEKVHQICDNWYKCIKCKKNIKFNNWERNNFRHKIRYFS